VKKRKFAENTTVPPEKSRAEIERMLTRYGATSFASGWQSGKATLLFEARGRRIRFELPLPEPGDRNAEQETRRRWRCLALAIKAKLETVENEISTFEDEFLAHVVLPNGETLSTWVGPQLAEAYRRGGSMPRLLGPGQ
jgi:hypothetical protein